MQTRKAQSYPETIKTQRRPPALRDGVMQPGGVSVGTSTLQPGRLTCFLVPRPLEPSSAHGKRGATWSLECLRTGRVEADLSVGRESCSGGQSEPEAVGIVLFAW